MSHDQIGSLDVPSPGFGTLRLGGSDEETNSVQTALEVGYRHVDAAQRYGNQEYVAEGIAASDVPREDIFLATKVLHPDERAEVDVEGTKADAYECLEDLGVDSADVLYIHWPDDYDLEVAFDVFETLYEEGVYDHLGVCNFTPDLLDEARELSARPIEVVQNDLNPLNQQEELREYCATHDIAVVGYCPLMRGDAPDVPELQDIADKHGVSAAQVSLAWAHEKGVVPIPRSSREAHIRDNWEARHLELDDEDVATIDAIDREEP